LKTSSPNRCVDNLEITNVESTLLSNPRSPLKPILELTPLSSHLESTPWSNHNEVENIQNNSNFEVCDFCGNENDKTKDDIRKNLTIVKVCQIDYFQNEKVEGGLISEGIFTLVPFSTKMW
jgi:hypothetical protein